MQVKPQNNIVIFIIILIIALFVIAIVNFVELLMVLNIKVSWDIRVLMDELVNLIIIIDSNVHELLEAKDYYVNIYSETCQKDFLNEKNDLLCIILIVQI